MTYSVVTVVNHLMHVSHSLVKLVRKLLLKRRQFLKCTVITEAETLVQQTSCVDMHASCTQRLTRIM